MNPLRREFLSLQFGKFIVVGGMAAAVNLLSRVLLSLALVYPAAVVVAYTFGMGTAYTLNTIFVFDPSGKGHRRQVAWFVLVNLAGVAQTLGVSLLFVDVILPQLKVTTLRQEIAHLFGVCAPMFTSYIGHKYLTFRRPA